MTQLYVWFNKKVQPMVNIRSLYKIHEFECELIVTNKPVYQIYLRAYEK